MHNLLTLRNSVMRVFERDMSWPPMSGVIASGRQRRRGNLRTLLLCRGKAQRNCHQERLGIATSFVHHARQPHFCFFLVVSVQTREENAVPDCSQCQSPSGHHLTPSGARISLETTAVTPGKPPERRVQCESNSDTAVFAIP